MKRLLGLALSVVFVLGACSDAPARYTSATELVADLRAGDVSCEGYTTSKVAELLSDQASCTSGDTPIDIYVFDDTKIRDRWLSLGAGLTDVVVGPNWVVAAPEKAEAVAGVLGGDIR